MNLSNPKYRVAVGFLFLVLWAIICLILVSFIFSEPCLIAILLSGTSSEEIRKQFSRMLRIIF